MKNFVFIGLLVVSFSLCVSKEPEFTVQQVTEKIQERYEMIDDASAQFEQHIRYGFSNLDQTFQGSILMKKPKHYRIDSEHQTIVTDGKTVWAYSKANNQVLIDTYKENNNSISPENFLLNLPSNYYASLLSQEEGAEGAVILLKLVPKDDRSFIKSVKLTVEEQGWTVRKVVILDINETETIYTIKEIKLNSNLKEKDFIFEAPEGSEVVDIR